MDNESNMMCGTNPAMSMPVKLNCEMYVPRPRRIFCTKKQMHKIFNSKSSFNKLNREFFMEYKNLCTRMRLSKYYN